MITKGERGTRIFERGIGVGDKAVQLSAGSMRMQFWIRSGLYVER